MSNTELGRLVRESEKCRRFQEVKRKIENVPNQLVFLSVNHCYLDEFPPDFSIVSSRSVEYNFWNGEIIDPFHNEFIFRLYQNNQPVDSFKLRYHEVNGIFLPIFRDGRIVDMSDYLSVAS